MEEMEALQLLRSSEPVGVLSVEMAPFQRLVVHVVEHRERRRGVDRAKAFISLGLSGPPTLSTIFPDASVRCPTRPLGGAARDAERGKRGRAGRLSSHAREAAAAEPASAAAAHLGPAAGRLGVAASRFAQYPRREEGRREEQQVTEQRSGWPSQSWSCGCSTCSPNKCSFILVGGQRGGGYRPTPLLCPGPLGCFPAGRAARLPRAGGAEAAMGQGGGGFAASPCCPAWEEEHRARQVSLCVLWAGRSRYRQGRGSQGLVLLWHWWQEG
nr:uncharacterized protein LOC120361585 [Saimiri boliviensis boliviensis]